MPGSFVRICGAGARVARAHKRRRWPRRTSARANGRRFLARTSEGAEPSEKSIVVMALWIFLQPLNVPYSFSHPLSRALGDNNTRTASQGYEYFMRYFFFFFFFFDAN